MAERAFNLPDPGEGLTEAEIVTWHVKVGDEVKVNDVVVEVETAKSLVELPIPYAGTVTALHAGEGDTVEVGTPIITVDDPGFVGATEGGSPSGASVPAQGVPRPAAIPEPATRAAARVFDGGPVPEEPAEGTIGGTTSTGRTAVLVGYGVKQTEATRRPRRKDAILRDIAAPPGEHIDAHDPARVGELVAAHAPEVRRDNRTLEELAEVHGFPAERAHVLAKPPVRKLARDLDVDLALVQPTGPGGTVSRADVESVAAARPGEVAGSAPSPGSSPAPGAREQRVPVKGVRKLTAQAMVASAFTAPHVTEWVQVDVTATMDLVERLKSDKDFADVKVTPLLVLARAVCIALRRSPGVNAVWDDAAQEIVLKSYVNLGIAAATPRGLVVPNVKDAQALDLHALAAALGTLTETARAGRSTPSDMAGGTFTITNVGVFGVDGGTPIINPGESAILAFGAVRRLPWVVTTTAGEERVEPRWVSTLSLSFDHRLVDGELGSRFLADVATLLADPTQALVWG